MFALVLGLTIFNDMLLWCPPFRRQISILHALCHTRYNLALLAYHSHHVSCLDHVNSVIPH